MSEARTLTANVVVRNQENDIVVLKSGEELPEWAVDQVGEHVLGGVTTTTADPYKADAGDLTIVKNEDGTEVSVNHADDTEQPADEEDEDVPPYSEWSKTDLKAEARGRGLSGYSNLSSDELVSLLEEDDAANAEEANGEEESDEETE